MLKNDKPLFGLFQDRIELANYIANLRMKNLQRFADRRSIVEKYIGGDVSIHAHTHCSHSIIDAPENGLCLCYRSIVPSEVHALGHEVANNGQLHELPVFVYVRKSVQKLKIRSVVRLEPLDHREVFIGEMYETARPILGEEPWLVIDRKLSSILDRTRIDASENEDNMIKRGAKMENNLTDQNEQTRQCFTIDREKLLSGCVLTVGNLDLEMTFTKFAGECLQLRQLFACPFNPELGLLKSAHLLYSIWMDRQGESKQKTFGLAYLDCAQYRGA
jgi:hypothetical protein